MKSTIEYLIEVKKKLGIASDYGLAKALETSQQAVSRYMTGQRVIDDYIAGKSAQILGISELEVIAAANAEREKDVDRKAFWSNLYLTLTQTAAAAINVETGAARKQKAPAGIPAEALKQWRKGGDSNPR